MARLFSRLAVAAAVAAWLVCAASCAHSAECRQRISACLERCPPREPTATVPPGPGSSQPMVVPSDCEQRCNNVCGTKDRRYIEPARSPTG